MGEEIGEKKEQPHQISDFLGAWGPLHTRLITVLSVIYVIAPLNNAGFIFYMMKDDFTCADNADSPLSNWTKTNQCTTKDNTTCSAWNFKHERSTILNEWSLVCHRSWFLPFSLSVYQIGYAVSGVFIGYISDHYGRKRALLISVIIEIISCGACVLSQSLTAFLVTRFFMGFAGYGRFLSAVLLLTECVGLKYRPQTVVVFDYTFNILKILIVPYAYWVKNFRHYLLSSMIYEICILVLFPFIPESPRWQLINNRQGDAQQTLLKYKRKSRHYEADEITLKIDNIRQRLQKDTEGQKKASIIDLWKQKRLMKYCVLFYILWFVIAFINYGFSFAVLDFAGDVFVNKAIVNFASLLANILLYFVVKRFDRRPTVMFFTVFCSVVLALLAPIAHSNDYQVLNMVLVLLGKLSGTALFIFIYLYTPENFPTSVRHVAVGWCSVAGRMGSIISPFMNEVTRIFSLSHTIYTFSAMALIGALSAYFLPESKGKEIPDTMQDMMDAWQEQQKEKEQPMKEQR